MEKFSDKKIKEIINALSCLKIDEFKNISASLDPNLNSIIKKFNEVSAYLKLQADAQSEQITNFKGLFDSLPSMVSYWDTNFVNIYANSAYTDYFGKPIEQIRGQHMSDVLGLEIFQKNLPFAKVALEGQMQSFENEIPSPDQTGSKYILANYIPKFENNKVIGFFVMVTDITEIKAREDKHNLIFKTISQGLVIHELSGKIVNFNPMALTILGLSEDELLGRSSIDSRWKAIREDGSDLDGTSHPAMIALKTGKQVLNFIMGVQRPDGELRWLRVSAIPFNSINNSTKKISYEVQVLVSFEDFTDMVLIKNQIEDQAKEQQVLKEKAHEAELQVMRSAKLASLGEMSACMAHEINNPLTIITGTVWGLSRYLNDPVNFQEKVTKIQKAVARITKIINALKKFSHASGENIFTNQSLAEIVSECLTLIEIKSKLHNTTIIYDIKTDAMIFCDQFEIEQVLINLISNSIDAVKNYDEKWVKIELSTEAQSVVLRVTDSGLGIPEEVQRKIFDPFFTTKVIGEGTGLGLSICKGILEKHLASISIVPNVSNTCFEIRFPKVAIICAK